MGSEPEYPGAFIGAVRAGDMSRTTELLGEDPALARASDENGVSALLNAHYHGRTEIVNLLLGTGLVPDVFEAAALGDVDRLSERLEADPTLVGRHAPDGFTLLQLASFFGHPEAVELVLEAGADVGVAAKNETRVTALHSAAAARQVDIARRLIECGADVKAQQEGGFTALHAAAQNGDLELARLLLEHGANPSTPAADGRTPLAIAEAEGHEEVAALLRA
jgi:ankyrin repeat protein